MSRRRVRPSLLLLAFAFACGETTVVVSPPCAEDGTCGVDAGDAPDANDFDAGRDPETDGGAIDAGIPADAGACVPAAGTESNCGDGRDDDCDGLADCLDPDCDGRACEDGDRCTTGEFCAGGACGDGEPVFCLSSPGPCFAPVGACDPSSGECRYAPRASGEPCGDDGNPCASDACDGAGACLQRPVAQGEVCRPSAGDCDPAEVCDGTGAPCPADALRPAGRVCRGSGGGCDAAETCTGDAVGCPADLYDPACACPADGPIVGYAEHDGLRAISAANFALRDTGTWSAHAAALDALGLPAVGLDVLPLNRSATKLSAQSFVGYSTGFAWEPGDQQVAYWIPQGLAGGTGGGRKLVAVSWHYDEANNAADSNPPLDGTDKGVRVSFAEVTDLNGTIGYRHVLLVEPDSAKGFKAVRIHAGGMAWYGSLLYVADTSRGVRVFDLTRILEVSTGGDCSARVGLSGGVHCGYGYRYVLPQIGGYYFPSGLSTSCRPKFSFLSLDRSSTPPSLISGEYENDPVTGIYSRLLRWPLDPASGRLAADARGAVRASGAWYAGSRNLQGAVARDGKFFLNATRYSGALFTSTPGSAARVYRADANRWAWMPEGMHLSTTGNLWSCTEGHPSGPRVVFAARVAEIP